MSNTRFLLIEMRRVDAARMQLPRNRRVAASSTSHLGGLTCLARCSCLIPHTPLHTVDTSVGAVLVGAASPRPSEVDVTRRACPAPAVSSRANFCAFETRQK